MTRPQARPRIGLAAGKTPAARASTTWALSSLSAICTSETMATAPVSIVALNLRTGRLTSPASTRPAFGFPRRKTAVEDERILGAEDAEGPPHARRRIEAGRVIDHDSVGLGDAERAHRRAELVRSGQHVRQIGGRVGDGVEVEEHRARNMRGDIFRLGVALLRWQIIGCVDDDDIGLAELAGEPFGGS